MIETIQEINNPVFKNGMGKNGKPYTMMQVTTDKNNLVTVFAPANVGDRVEVEWNAQYGNFNGRVLKKEATLSNPAAKVELTTMLKRILELLEPMYGVVMGQEPGYTKPAPKPVQQPYKTAEPPHDDSDMPADFLLPEEDQL